MVAASEPANLSAMVEQALKSVLTSGWFLWFWGALALLSVGVLLHDLIRRNPEIHGLMKWVWIFTVAYSGPFGLAVYFYSGRKQIAR